MKTLKRILISLFLLLFIVVMGIFFYIDGIARHGVEAGATYALGVPTTLRSMSIGILRGRVAMGGLNVSNPDGFDTDHFMAMEDGRVEVSLGTLRQEVVRLPELTLAGLSMNLENKSGSANYKVIMDNLKKLDSGNPPAEESSSPPKKFVIDTLLVKDIDVNVKTIGLGAIRPDLPLHIDQIALSNVGSDGQGVEMSELSGILIKAILDSVLKLGSNVLPKELIGDLSSGLKELNNLQLGSIKVGDITALIDGKEQSLESFGKKLQDGLQNTTSEITDKTREISEQAGKAGEELKKGLGDLLGGDKKDDDKDDE